MKFKAFLAVLLTTTFLLTNCGSNLSKPSGTLNEFSARIKNKDVENLDELFSEKFKDANGIDFINRIKTNFNDEKILKENPQLTSFEIENEEIVSDRASVTTKSISKSGKINKTIFVLVKESGEWKIENIEQN